MLCRWSGPSGFMLLQRFSVGLIFEYSSCFITALNHDLIMFAVLIEYKNL